MKVLVKENVIQTGLTGTTNSIVIDIAHSSTPSTLNNYPATTISIQNVIDVNTPVAVVVPSSDISVADDTFTKTAHGLFTGLKGQFTTSSALPTGISSSTDYFIIVVSSSVFKVATSYNNAL